MMPKWQIWMKRKVIHFHQTVIQVEKMNQNHMRDLRLVLNRQIYLKKNLQIFISKNLEMIKIKVKPHI